MAPILKPKQTHIHRINCRLTQEEEQQLEDLMVWLGRNKSDVIRMALRHYFYNFEMTTDDPQLS